MGDAIVASLSARRRAARVLVSLSVAHSACSISRHLWWTLCCLRKISKIPLWWAAPLQLFHIFLTILRTAGRRLVGAPRSRRWGVLLEIFVEGTRPHPMFVRNWDRCVVPFIEAITTVDHYGELLARIRHPRVRIETVTQGCPRPMTWVWFEDAPEAVTAPEVVILYLHGGGYWAFTGKSHLEYVTRIVKGYLAIPLRVKACVVDLRRAPEHPWPAPLEDAMASYDFLQKGAGYDASKILLAGDSAGGGLCLCTLLAIRDARKQLPLCATVISPLTDLSRCAEQYPQEGCRASPYTDFLPPEAATMSRPLYVGQENPKNPLISPKYGQLHALPPILIQAGESELLAQDSVDYARRLEIYRGTVQLEMYPEMPHVFPMFAPLGLEDAHTAVRRQAKFVKKVLGGSFDGGSRRVQIVPTLLKRNMSLDKVRDSPTSVRMTQNASSPVLAGAHSKHGSVSCALDRSLMSAPEKGAAN